jgi:Ca-activated chloride channel family protein
MAYGRPATVRSHRRGGPRRRLNVAPWIVISMVVVLVLSGLTAGYVYLVRQSCSGSATASIVASTATKTILENLARQWAASEPAVDGKCASVEISAKDSAQMADALQEDWDAKANGLAPDAWVPQSSAWVRRAAVDADAERMVPDLQPSIARSPVVIAMPKPMAEALGWPKTAMSWQDVLTKFAEDSRGWQSVGKSWGPFKFGMTDPAKSTAGLLALTAFIDGDDNGETDAGEQQEIVKLKQVMTPYQDSTEQILNEFKRASNSSEEDALKYVSAFPAFEQDVLNYNLLNPKVPLVAIYPNNASIDADHPFILLNAPWARPEGQRVATAFMQYVRGPEGRHELLDAGFRDPNRAPGPQLNQQNGLAPEITALPRSVLLPDAVTRTLTTWTALTQPTNVLLVLDISGSMKEAVPGTGQTRMALAKQAARAAADLFPPDAHVGLWTFSTQLSGNRDWRSVVTVGPLSEELPNGRTRDEELARSIDNIQLLPSGDTGLYDTILAAQKSMMDSFRKGATNVVVLLTDGKNDDPGGGLTVDQLKAELTKNRAVPDRKVPVVLVGYGTDVDFAILQELSTLTGTTARSSREAFDINQVLIQAIFTETN